MSAQDTLVTSEAEKRRPNTTKVLGFPSGKIITAGVIVMAVIAATKVLLRRRDGNAGVRDSNGGVVPTASSSSSLSTCRSWKYDVFLSFRGEDTRKTFVDHLYTALEKHGLLTYKDDVTLDRGDTIGPSLKNAIHESNIALIIFSENYADSSWCLDELSYIMKCKEGDSGQIIIPIFYNVDPSDVRKQKGKFGKAFAKLHKLSKNNKNKVESWKKTLVDASNIAGWEPKHVANGHEARCIQEIVDFILTKLSSLDSAVKDENLVGMGTRLEQLKFQLRIGSGGVRMVGIWGLGGGGKTTLATSLYKEFSPTFDRCCFLGSIREETKQHGLKRLQENMLSTVFDTQMHVDSVELGKHMIKQMLCRKKVLIVLDDVDHLDQLEALAGYHNWFGEGSCIIITTRNQHLLSSVDEIEVYPISLLSHEEAVQLFNKRAYNAKKPVEDYEVLSQEVVTYAAGLPLALIVLGSFLYDKDKDEWLSTLDRLKYHPEMGIVEKLKISYNGLKEVEKELFLDIACFHRREHKDEAMEILDACGFYPAIGIKVLIQKALITISEDCKFDMHDLVQEMAHYIVMGENPKNPEKYSRVWRNEDIADICSRNATMENDKIEAIHCCAYRYSLDNFMMHVSNMKKLRFLKVSYTSFDEGPGFLSNELRYLSWSDYPASPVPESFQPRKLVVMKIQGSLQNELWKGYKYMPCLKKMELSDMKALVRTPDISGLECLQKLILDGCESLEEIHQSLGSLSSLVHLFVRRCDKLTRFPSIVKMNKLKILKISECEALVEFPKIEANLDSLVELSLYKVGIEILPSTIGEYCTNLTLLSLDDCNLKRIDGNFKGLENFKLKTCHLEKLQKDIFNENLDGLGLRKLVLHNCKIIDGYIPNEIGGLSNLRELDLSRNPFKRLDFRLSRLTRLEFLDLHWCKNLVELPELPSSLAILNADRCKSLEVIKKDAHRRCKWLCQVSIHGWRKIISGGEKLLESMLQGKAGKSGCMILRLNELEIHRGFEPPLVMGRRCRMQLPENWYNHFSGFLICATSDDNIHCPIINMKHVEKLVGGSLMYSPCLEEETTVDDVYTPVIQPTTALIPLRENTCDTNITWVTYTPFSLLRHTSWWDPTSTSVEMELDNSTTTAHSSSSSDDDGTQVRKCGLKLVPKGGVAAAAAAECSSSETTPIAHSSSDDDDDDDDDGDGDDDYKCKFDILHDSKSALKFQISFSDLLLYK